MIDKTITTKVLSMKKIFTIAAIAAATVLSASCAKEIEGEFQKEGIIAHASLQPVEATKAIGEYSYNIVWEENDKIAVLDKDNNKASFKLTTGAGTTTGTFQQEGTDALTAPLTAYYPASVVAEDKSLVWPATQADVKNISNVPMTTSSQTATGGVNFAFKHLGSVLQLVLTAKNGEINVKQIDITADQGLSGAFTVENGAAVISSAGTTITTGDISDKNIKLSATASYLNFAVPSGSFTNFAITITDTNDKEYSLSAASLTLNRAMVNKVTFAMDAKDPAVFEVNVNGHTVRVKLSDDVVAHDVIVDAYADGNNAIVSAFSKSGQHLKCTMSDGEFCSSQSKTSNMAYTFTLSDITEDTTATIGYAKELSISVSPENSGTVEITGEAYEGEIAALKAIPAYKYGFDAWLDKDGNPLSCEEETYSNVRLSSGCTSVKFKENLILDGVFSIADDHIGNVRKVRFTRGNLYLEDYPECKIEQRQYEYGTSFPSYPISHFMWCNNISDAVQQRYEDAWYRQEPFFTEINFSVSGFSENQCRTLTNEEWQYLFSYGFYANDARRDKYLLGVEVCGNENCVVLLPDNWIWGSNENKKEYNYVEWKHMEAAGAVCLPAAGYRDGENSSTTIEHANVVGYYWSTTPSGESAYYLWFDYFDVYLDHAISRGMAESVRLVVDVK